MKNVDLFRKILGIKVLDVKEGYAKLSLKLTKDHTNSLGAAHGGAIFSLADCAFAEAANYGDNIGIAVQVNINYLRPASEGDVLIAEAICVSDGKTLGLYHVNVTKEKKKIAFFSGLAYKPKS
jgi:acyl-CoA thioesterase